MFQMNCYHILLLQGYCKHHPRSKLPLPLYIMKCRACKLLYYIVKFHQYNHNHLYNYSQNPQTAQCLQLHIVHYNQSQLYHLHSNLLKYYVCTKLYNFDLYYCHNLHKYNYKINLLFGLQLIH